VQGVLGGVRVLLDARQVAMIHGCTGPVFFAYTAILAVLTSKWWRTTSSTRTEAARTLTRVAALTTLLAYCQLLLGAQLRHLHFETPFRVLVIFHILLAVALLAHGFVVAAIACLSHWSQRMLTAPALLLCCLLVVQTGLGAGTWAVNYSLPGWDELFPSAAGYTIVAEGVLQTNIVTAHVATGSLILAAAAVLTAACARTLTGNSGDGVSGEDRQAKPKRKDELSSGADKTQTGDSGSEETPATSGKSREKSRGKRSGRQLRDVQPLASHLQQLVNHSFSTAPRPTRCAACYLIPGAR